MFVACYVASIGRILSPVDKGYSEMVSGRKLACTELPRSSLVRWGVEATQWRVWCILWHAGAWKPRCSVAGCILRYAIAWDSTL